MRCSVDSVSVLSFPQGRTDFSGCDHFYSEYMECYLNFYLFFFPLPQHSPFSGWWEYLLSALFQNFLVWRFRATLNSQEIPAVFGKALTCNHFNWINMLRLLVVSFSLFLFFYKLMCYFVLKMHNINKYEQQSEIKYESASQTHKNIYWCYEILGSQF